MNEERAEIVKSGRWLYDDLVEWEVWIVKQNFDYWFEEGFDDAPRLNNNGECFAVLHVCGETRTDIGGQRLTLADAMGLAEASVPQGIRWDDARVGQALQGGGRYERTK